MDMTGKELVVWLTTLGVVVTGIVIGNGWLVFAAVVAWWVAV